MKSHMFSGSSGSGSRIDINFRAVLGPVLLDFCPFSGSWVPETEPSQKLMQTGLATLPSSS